MKISKYLYHLIFLFRPDNCWRTSGVKFWDLAMNRIFVSALVLVASAVPAFAGISTVPVPEPATMGLFAAGAGGVYLVKRFIGRK